MRRFPALGPGQNVVRLQVGFRSSRLQKGRGERKSGLTESFSLLEHSSTWRSTEKVAAR